MQIVLRIGLLLAPAPLSLQHNSIHGVKLQSTDHLWHCWSEEHWRCSQSASVKRLTSGQLWLMLPLSWPLSTLPPSPKGRPEHLEVH